MVAVVDVEEPSLLPLEGAGEAEALVRQARPDQPQLVSEEIPASLDRKALQV